MQPWQQSTNTLKKIELYYHWTIQHLSWCLAGIHSSPISICDSSWLRLREAIDGREEELGCQLVKRRSRWIGPEEVQHAQELLCCVETSVAKVGLKMNSGKTKYMSLNVNQRVPLKTNDGTALEEVSNFKYHGAWMASTEKDIKMCKGAAWRACSKITKIWKSTIPKQLDHWIFAAMVESDLLYGCEAWTIINKVERDLNGCYTRMLRTVYNIHWKQYDQQRTLWWSYKTLTNDQREKRALCRPLL